MGWTKKGASVKPTTTAPDFSAASGEIYVNTTDGTMYVSLGDSTWSTVISDSTYVVTEPEPVTGDLILGNASGESNNYVYSTDDASSWDIGTITTGGTYQITEIAQAGSTLYTTLEDLAEEEISAYSIDNGVNWTVGDYVGTIMSNDDIMYKFDGVTLQSKIDDGAFVDTTVGEEIGSMATMGSSYVVSTETEVLTSIDGVTYGNLDTNSFNEIIAIEASDSRIVGLELRLNGDIGFQYWNSGTWADSTFSITPGVTEYDCNGIAYLGSNFVTVIFDEDGEVGTVYTSTDGDTWTTMTTPGTNLFPYFVKTIGSNMYMILVDLVNGNNSYSSTSVDGLVWSTPVQITTGSFVSSIA